MSSSLAPALPPQAHTAKHKTTVNNRVKSFFVFLPSFLKSNYKNYSPIMGNCQYTYNFVGLLYKLFSIEEANSMITFEPLWETMKAKGISQYKLIKEYKISTGQLDRLRKNGNVNTYTLNLLCEILDCDLSDIARFTKEESHE